MRFYNDERRKSDVGDLYEIAYRNGERNNVGVQILHGLQRAKDNIRNIRVMRQQRTLEDKQREFAIKKADLDIQNAELQFGPDAVAAKKENLNLLKKKAKIDSLLADRDLQSAELSEQEKFASGVSFVRKINKQCPQWIQLYLSI